MIPLVKLTGGTLDAVFLYTAILGILLLIATVIRVHIPLFKRLFIPASLIAGIIGLILGPHMLKVIPAEIYTYWSALAGRLIVLVFAPMMITGSLPKFKKLANIAGPQVVFSYASTFLQYSLPLLLGAVLLGPVFGVNDLFGTIVEQGWAGGHGTSGGMSAIFNELGYPDGASLSVTSATVGLIFGIVGGTAIINFAVRKGWTSVLKVQKNGEETSDLFGKERSQIGSNITISQDVIEGFAFHLSLIGVAMFIGWLLVKACKIYLKFSVAWFVTAMIGGLIVQLVIGGTKWNKCIDKATMSRIQGISLEFLVAGAVASVNVPIVVAYAVPLLIQQISMMVAMVAMVFWLAPRVFKTNWLENAMVLFGTFCGVAATGLLLLRTVDPEMKTDVSEAFAARTPFCSPLLGGGLLTGITPGMVAQYGSLKVGIAYTIGLVIILIVPRIFGWWNSGERIQ